jgi:hypothetical protein
MDLSILMKKTECGEKIGNQTDIFALAQIQTESKFFHG